MCTTVSIVFVTYSRETTLLLFFIFGGACIYEYLTLLEPTISWYKLLVELALGTGPMSIYISQFYVDYDDFGNMCMLFIIAYATFILSLAVPGTLRLWLVMIWINPCMIISMKYALEDPMKIITVMTIIFMTDGFAYIGGKLIGRTKLPYIQHISPNKTIEGTLTGILASIVTAYIFSLYYFRISQPHLLVLGVICSITGQIGDLTESAFKRKLGVKDTGTCLPGVGGALDRLDSPLFAIPSAYIYLTYFT